MNWEEVKLLQEQRAEEYRLREEALSTVGLDALLPVLPLVLLFFLLLVLLLFLLLWLLLILLLILLLDRVVFLCLRLLRPGLHWLVPVVELARGLTPISSS